MHADVSQIGRGAPAAPTSSAPTLDLDAIATAASAADLACEFTGRAPWTAQAADPRFPYLDQEIVGADGEVVARLLYGPELAAYLAAMSPDVALALFDRVRELEAECTRLRADAARLDWLDRAVKDEGAWHDLVLCSDWEDGVWISRVRRGEYRGAIAIDRSDAPLADVRTAIDAARAGEAGEG